MRFGRRDSRQELEAELFESRPEPSETFVTALGARVEADRQRSRRRTYARLSLAWGISVLVFGSLAAFGGIGYAASSTIDVAKVAKSVVSPANPKPTPVRIVSGSPAQDQYKPPKTTICHRTKSGRRVTITISRSALPGHLAHGDTIGRCPVTVAGTIGPGSAISLRLGGAKLTKLKAGVTYRFVIKDQSSNHNFHLTGPGVNKVVTGVGFKGTKTVVLKLKKGTYRFVSDALPGSIHGSFTVS